jgi:hypothetical protein
MKFKILMYVVLLSYFLHDSVYAMMGRSLVKPIVQPRYKEYTNSSSPDYIQPQVSPSVMNASQKSQYNSIVADSLSQSADNQNEYQNESSVSKGGSGATQAPQGYLSLYDRVFAGMKFKPSEKSQSSVIDMPESQVVESSPSHFDVLLNRSRAVPMQEIVLEPTVGIKSSESVAQVDQNNLSLETSVFSGLSSADRANLIKLKNLMKNLSIDSQTSQQYQRMLQQNFNGRLPENITFEILQKSSIEDIQSGVNLETSSAVDSRGVVGSARSLDELLSPARASKQRSVEQENNNSSQQAPLTFEQVQNKVLEDAVSQAFSAQNPNDPLVSLTLPDKARSLAQQALTKYFEDVARKKFAVDKSSLIASYKNENAQALNKLFNKKGQEAVDARVNRAMYEKLTERLKQVAIDTQKTVEAVGEQAKQQAKQQLQDNKNKPIVAVARPENDNTVSRVRNEAQQAVVQKLKNRALKDFNRDLFLKNEITSDFKDGYFAKNSKLPEQKDINKAIDDYFNTTIMSQVKKDNQGIINQAGQDAVAAWQVKQQKQTKSNRGATSPVTVASVV